MRMQIVHVLVNCLIFISLCLFMNENGAITNCFSRLVPTVCYYIDPERSLKTQCSNYPILICSGLYLWSAVSTQQCQRVSIAWCTVVLHWVRNTCSVPIPGFTNMLTQFAFTFTMDQTILKELCICIVCMYMVDVLFKKMGYG